MSDGLQRRDFLKVIGASGAGAGLVGCSTEGAEKLLPYVTPPEEITPGVATWYASTCDECAAGCGVWARTREGRVVKVEGNPNHPVSHGTLCSRGHSALQGLYNPDRLAHPMRKNGETFETITWDEAEQLLADQVQAAGGRVAFLRGSTGPSMTALIDGFISAVGGTVAHYDGLADSSLEAAARIAFGTAAGVRYDLDQANLVFSFGADFLGGWTSQVEYSRKYAAMSHTGEDGAKGKMVFLGPRLSLTGQNADEWIPIPSGTEAAVALAMASRIASRNNVAGPYDAQLRGFDVAGAARDAGVTTDDINRLADEFASSGASVAVGPGLHGQHAGATAANLAVLILNDVAGNIGRTVHRSVSRGSGTPSDLVDAVRSAAGGVVMVHGPNPAYGLPSGAGFAEAFAEAGFRVSFAQTMDETAALCDLVLPDRNSLESWGDHDTDGTTTSIRQPVMQPLPMFDSKQTGDVLLSVAGRLSNDLGATTFFDYLQNRWRGAHAAIAPDSGFDEWWRAALRDGFVTAGTNPTTPALQVPNTAISFETPAFEGNGDFYLTVHPSGRLGDGRYANRPWLQELPDPVSKVMWQAFLEIHPNVAEEMDLRDGDHVRVTSLNGELELPVWVYPGIRPDTVALAMGGGHTNFGQFATNQGVNAMDLLSGAGDALSGAMALAGARVSITPTGEWTRPANIAGSTDDHDRPLVPAIALADLGHEGEHAEDDGHGQLQELQLMGGFKPTPTDGNPEDYPLAGTSEYSPYNDPTTPRWAMAIDLDKCTGCSACVTACQSENNIPFVGENQAVMGREMHWMRIERYYETVDAEHAGPVDVRFLPMLCQQCGNAPCEPVCPVFATYHTPDGINAQIYNRCVGTRYCANNCPYKLRVYNWYRYATQLPEPLNWQFNPEVTVRDNGVMEKCSFCLHRVREAGHAASLADRDIHDGEVVTACQQSCPAEAIVFGNIRDTDSAIAHAVANERTYRVLDELINTQPAVSYQKKVTFHEVAAPEH